MLFQYRAAALAGLTTQVFWGLIRMMIFTAFYQSTTKPMPMNISETINYIWLGQAMLLLLPWWGDREIAQMIRRGGVAYELVRPVDLYWMWFGRSIAQRIAPVLMRATPMFILAGLFFKLQPPAGFGSAFAFIVSIVGAAFLSSAIVVLLNISLFWTISGEGMTRLVPGIAWFLSGIVVPLPFFPQWIQSVLSILPFRGIIDVPFRLYVGHIPASRAPLLILTQVLWIVVIVLFSRWLLQRGVRKVEIQGG